MKRFELSFIPTMYKNEIILNNFSFYYFSQVYLNNLIRLKNFQDANVQKIETQYKLGKSFLILPIQQLLQKYDSNFRKFDLGGQFTNYVDKTR